ncbi:MAG: hypothetical protein R2771_00340 [Saprospiraceae bacterium]
MVQWIFSITNVPYVVYIDNEVVTLPYNELCRNSHFESNRCREFEKSVSFTVTGLPEKLAVEVDDVTCENEGDSMVVLKWKFLNWMLDILMIGI